MRSLRRGVWWVLQGPLAADADDPAVADSDDEKKHKLEAQAARNHDALDIFADQVRRHGKTRQDCDMMVLIPSKWSVSCIASPSA